MTYFDPMEKEKGSLISAMLSYKIPNSRIQAPRRPLSVTIYGNNNLLSLALKLLHVSISQVHEKALHPEVIVKTIAIENQTRVSSGQHPVIHQ